MEGFIAVAGFWTFLIICALRKPIAEVIAARAIPKHGPAETKEIAAMRAQIASLESQLSSVQTEMLEVRDSHEFMNKLLTTQKAQTTAQSR